MKDNKEKVKEYNKQYRLDNKEKIKEYNKQYSKQWQLDNKEKLKQYRLDNKQKISEQQKQWRLDNKEKQKQYHLDNKEKRKEYRKEYNLQNKEKFKNYFFNNKEKINEYYKNKRITDPLYKLRCNISTLLYLSIKRNGYTKKSKSYKILGCSFEEFKLHLEKQFTKGMNWENQGKWHLDHIYPVSLAKDEEELIRLNHYTNFQPLWAIDNIKKGNKL